MQAGKANYLQLREAETEDILQRRDLSLILIFVHCGELSGGSEL